MPPPFRAGAGRIVARTQGWYGQGQDEESRYPDPSLGNAPPAIPISPAPYAEQPGQERSWALTWFAPDVSVEGLTPPSAAAFDPAPVAGVWPDASGQQDASSVQRWYSPEEHVLGLPPFAITSATTDQQEAATDPDDTPQVWRDSTPWVPWTDDDQDSALPPSAAFDPTAFAGAWPEQPQAWNDATPWTSRVDDDDDDGFQPTPNAATIADIWDAQPDRDLGSRWFAPDLPTEGLPGLPNAYAGADLADSPQLWLDGTPWVARTEEDVDASLPPAAAFDPAPLAGVWQEGPEQLAWHDATPRTEDDVDGSAPAPSAYAGADLAEYSQVWRDGTPWVTRTEDVAEGFAPLATAYSGFDLQEQPAAWQDGTPWIPRTDEDIDSALPPAAAFDPATAAGLWPEQPQAWVDGSPWFSPDPPSEGALPLVSGYAGADLADYVQTWRDATPWLTADELAWVEIPGLTVATVDQASPGLQPDAEQRDLSIRWYQEPDDQLGAVPIVTAPPTVAQQSPALQPEQLLADRTVTWFQPDTETLGSPALPNAPTEATLDEQPQSWRDGSPWLTEPDPTLGAVPITVVVTVDQQSPALQPDADQVNRDVRWFQPDTEVLGSPALPSAPAFPLDEQTQAWSNSWASEQDGAFLAPVPGITPEQLASLWAEQPGQDRSLQPVWAQPDTEALGAPPSTPPSDLGWDAQQERSPQAVWFQPDTESWVPGAAIATIPQLAALWPDTSGQQDRSLQPLWWLPPDETVIRIAPATGFPQHAVAAFVTQLKPVAAVHVVEAGASFAAAPKPVGGVQVQGGPGAGVTINHKPEAEVDS